MSLETQELALTRDEIAMATIVEIAVRWVKDWYDDGDRDPERRSLGSDILVQYGDVWDVIDAARRLALR